MRSGPAHLPLTDRFIHLMVSALNSASDIDRGTRLSTLHGDSRPSIIPIMHEDLTDAVVLLRTRLPFLLAVYLFGSRASEQSAADSDVDLAVLDAERLDPAVRWELQEDLAARLHGDVDLVDLRSASTVMRVQVLERSTLLFDGDPGSRVLFEAMALSAYARLNEERRGILLDVRARGTVYG